MLWSTAPDLSVLHEAKAILVGQECRMPQPGFDYCQNQKSTNESRGGTTGIRAHANQPHDVRIWLETEEFRAADAATNQNS